MRTAAALLCFFSFGALSFAAEDAVTTANSAGGPGASSPSSGASAEMESLKAQVAAQQKQIEELRRGLEEQKKWIEKNSGASSAPASANPAPSPAPSVGMVASAVPMAPSAAAPAPLPLPAASPVRMPQAEAPPASPLTIRIGSANLTPLGFMDFTEVFRSTATGNGIGTNFGSIPYNNVPAGGLTESRFSAQNSRVGLRVDAKVRGASVIGYMEADLLGAAPNNLSVTSNSDTWRLRLYWVDWWRGQFEFLGGQSWSMMTPGRRGISPLPADLFYSQDMDVNYQAGLTWTRAPQFRFIWHPDNKLSWGFAIENAEQYIGGSGGGGVVTLPSGLAGSFASQLDNGNVGPTTVPNLHPDFQSKIAYDLTLGGKLMHMEAFGVATSVRTFVPTTNTRYTTTGGGGGANVNLEVVKNLRLIANTYWSDGGGRYIFGLAPDAIVQGNGRPSLIHAGSTIGGFEWTHRNTLVYSYYGGVYIKRNSAVDPATGKLVGYGYAGSPNSQNRTIQEATFGLVQTFWRDPKYGALSLITQYSYLTRDPWAVALGQPKNAHLSMAFVDLRYTLPGAPAPAEEGTALPAGSGAKSPGGVR